MFCMLYKVLIILAWKVDQRDFLSPLLIGFIMEDWLHIHNELNDKRDSPRNEALPVLLSSLIVTNTMIIAVSKEQF